MRLANLEAFKRYAANLEKHNIPVNDRQARLGVAMAHSALFLSPREYARCNAFVTEYAA